jgi:hypothetical protein
MPGAKYARGSQAWGMCQRCGLRALLRDLVFDGYMPGLRVHPECFDARHPQEFLQDVTDPIALWKPAPDEVAFTLPVLFVVAVGPPVRLAWTSADFGAYTTGNYQVYRGLPGNPYALLATFPNVYNIVEDDQLRVHPGSPGIVETLIYVDSSVIADTYNYYIQVNSLVTPQTDPLQHPAGPKIVLSNVAQAVVP